MDAILSRLPSTATLRRQRGAWAGFAAGVVGTIVLALFAQVLFTGTGIGETGLDPDRQIIYPNF